jgi:hypothetical protein
MPTDISFLAMQISDRQRSLNFCFPFAYRKMTIPNATMFRIHERQAMMAGGLE